MRRGHVVLCKGAEQQKNKGHRQDQKMGCESSSMLLNDCEMATKAGHTGNERKAAWTALILAS